MSAPPKAPELPTLDFDPSSLPLSHLESLRFKANQIIDSIQALQRTVDGGYGMPPWPEILSKYNILLSQTHNFSNSLSGTIFAPSLLTSTGSRVNGTGSGSVENPYERIALHPRFGMTDTQLDNEVIPLLRNQQTTDVLKMEDETVRRLSEHMVTKGSLGVLGGIPMAPAPRNGLSHLPYGSTFGRPPRKPEYEDVLNECAEIRQAHDHRVDRAIRAVLLLRDKFDWKQRVEVEVEEPEELTWDPRVEDVGDDDNVDMFSAVNSSDDEVEGQLTEQATPMES